jgi:hypothetical protein
MIGTALRRFIARLTAPSGAHNTLALPPPVEVRLQRSPGFPAGDVRGCNGVEFRVMLNGAVIQTGRTGADGRVDVRVPPGGSSLLQLMHGGAVVAEYEISVTADPLAAVATVEGQKQRLRLLGYQIGHSGPDGNGIDATQPMEFERSVLDMQVDTGEFTDANVTAALQGHMTTQAGA